MNKYLLLAAIFIFPPCLSGCSKKKVQIIKQREKEKQEQKEIYWYRRLCSEDVETNAPGTWYENLQTS